MIYFLLKHLQPILASVGIVYLLNSHGLINFTDACIISFITSFLFSKLD